MFHGMKRGNRDVAKRLLVAFVGVFLVASSIALFTTASFGTDPFTTFVIGIQRVSGFSYGSPMEPYTRL